MKQKLPPSRTPWPEAVLATFSALSLSAGLTFCALVQSFDIRAQDRPTQLTPWPQFQQLTFQYQQQEKRYGGPYEQSVVDGTNASLIDKTVGIEDADDPLIKITLLSEDFRTQGLPALFHQTPTEKPAPLTIYFPGMNQGLDHPYTKWFTTLLTATKSHVLAFPGVFSRDYRSSLPRAAAGSFDQEAKALLALVQQAIVRIGRQNISELRLVGQSYGATLTLILAATQELQLKMGPTLLLSLPVTVGTTRDLLDQGIEKHLTDESMSVIAQALLIRTRINGEDDARQLFYWTFRKDLIELALYFKVNDHRCKDWNAMTTLFAQHPQLHDFDYFSADHEEFLEELLENQDEAFLSFQREVHFQNVIKFCTPENLKLYPGSANYIGEDAAAYWLKSSTGNSHWDRSQIKFVIAQNDPINSATEFFNSSDLFKEGQNLMTLPFGGHNGFFFSNWTESLIQTLLAPPSEQ